MVWTKEDKVQDHLGSTRVVLSGGGTILGQYDYAPFGGILWQSSPTPRKGFIDKEKDAESGDHNFGVRYYSPDDGGRFTSIDPWWEKYREQTPYHYCDNNPLIHRDYTGKGIAGAWANDDKTGGLGGGDVAAAGTGTGIIGFIRWLFSDNTSSSNEEETVPKAPNKEKVKEEKKEEKQKEKTEEREWRQDKKLSKDEIKKLEKGDVDVHELKGGKRTGQTDLYKDRNGDIYIKPKSGNGPGEPTNLNINNF